MQQPADVVVRPAIKHVPCSVVPAAHERIIRCGLGIVPLSSETEDKFEDGMEVMASSPLPEIARVLLRFNHVAGRVPTRANKPTHELNSNAVVIASRNAASTQRASDESRSRALQCFTAATTTARRCTAAGVGQ
jgi:hypothetical protein